MPKTTVHSGASNGADPEPVDVVDELASQDSGEQPREEPPVAAQPRKRTSKKTAT